MKISGRPNFKNAFLLSLAVATTSPVTVQAGVLANSCSRLFSAGIINHQYLEKYDHFCSDSSCEALLNDQRLTASLVSQFENTENNPRLRMRIAIFIKNYPGYSADIKARANRVIAEIDANPNYRGMRADLNDIENKSLHYIDDQAANDANIDRLYDKLDRMAANVASGKRAGNQAYTEVLPDPVVEALRTHHQSIEMLEQDLRRALKQSLQNRPELAQASAAEALTVVRTLLNDPFIARDQQALSKRFQALETVLASENLSELAFYKVYVETLESKLKEFLKRADPELVQLSNESLHTEKVFLGSIFKGLVRREKNPLQAYVEFRQWLDRFAVNGYKVNLFGMKFYLPGVSTLLKRTDAISDLVQDTVFGKFDKNYMDGSSVAMGNDGVTHYIKKLLVKDAALRRMSIDFYAQLENFTPPEMKGSHPYTFWDKTNVDVWTMALNITKRADGVASPLHAMRILSVFGHNDFVENFDVSEEDLAGLTDAEKQKAVHDFSLLNHLRPDRNSPLYAPEAIPGLNLPDEMLSDMKAYQTQLKQNYDLYPSLYHDAYMEEFVTMKMFRSGYYHFYGGSYITAEFMANRQTRILGLNVPVSLSLVMGYYYKLITMEQTYLDTAEKLLYSDIGYKTRKTLNDAEMQTLLARVNEKLAAQGKAAWSPEQLKVAKLGLDINLLHLEITAYQHVVGADWAYDVLRQR